MVSLRWLCRREQRPGATRQKPWRKTAPLQLPSVFAAKRARRGGSSSRDNATVAGRPAGLGDYVLLSGGTGDTLEVACLGDAAD